MKNLILYAVSVCMLLSSCQKEDSGIVYTPVTERAINNQWISPVPSTFVKKSLVEHFVSASNGNTPLSSYTILQSLRANPGNVILSELHLGDAMLVNQSSRLLNSWGISTTAMPCASVDRNTATGNRILQAGQVNQAISSCLVKPSNCGLAMTSATDGRTALVRVYTGFTSNYTSALGVTAYLVEDQIINTGLSFAQNNNFNSDPGSPFYNLGNPIINYSHSNVVRKVLTLPLGNTIPATSILPGGAYSLDLKMDLPQKMGNNSKWKIITFITDLGTQEVLNVQEGLLGTTKDWN